MRTFLFKNILNLVIQENKLKYFLSKVLVAILFGRAEQFMQFGLRVLGGTCV